MRSLELQRSMACVWRGWMGCCVKGPQNIFTTLEAPEKHGVAQGSRSFIAIRKLSFHQLLPISKGTPQLFDCGRFHRDLSNSAAKLVVLVLGGVQQKQEQRRQHVRPSLPAASPARERAVLTWPHFGS